MGKVILVSLVLLMLMILRVVSPTSGQEDGFPVPVYGYRWNHPNLTYSLNNCDQETSWIQSALVAWVVAFPKYTGKAFFTFRPATGGSAGNGIDIPIVCKAQHLTLAEGGQAFPSYDNNMILMYVYIYLSDSPLFILGTIVRAIAMHEVGHALGLAHSSNMSDIMYSQFLLQNPIVSRNDVTSVITLHWDLYENQQQVFEFPAWAIPILLMICILMIRIRLRRASSNRTSTLLRCR